MVPHLGSANCIVHYGYADATKEDCAVMLSTDISQVNGWNLEHLDYSNKKGIWFLGESDQSGSAPPGFQDSCGGEGLVTELHVRIPTLPAPAIPRSHLSVRDCNLEVFSEDSSLNGSGASLISLGANPCRESIPIYLSGYEGKQFHINLIDLSGRSVYSDRVLCQSSAIHISIEDYPMGVYVLSLRTEDHTELFKVMIR